MVSAQNIKKSFSDPKRGRIQALDGVTVEARAGRVFGLLGVNGAGKTTLLRVLATLVVPDEGEAQVAGHDVLRDPAAVRASIGFLSSTSAIYARLTVTEALVYYGELNGLSAGDAKARVRTAIDRLRLDEFRNQLCEKLSTGQRQRVMIARAMLHDPPVLFFDEPTAGLDVVMKQGVMEFIEECRDEGKTVVFSTHVMSEAQRLCDDFAVIHEGRVVTSGQTADFVQGHANLEQAFLAAVGYQAGAVA